MHKIILGGDDNFTYVEHIPIKRSVIHEDYYHDSKTYDFWVIQLEWASQLYGNQYINLDEVGNDDEYDPAAGHDLVTIGFGRKKDENQQTDDDDDDFVPYIYPNVLQETTVQYITNNDCTNGEDYYYDHSEIYKSMLCAGGVNGEDTCEASLVLVISSYITLLLLNSLLPPFDLCFRVTMVGLWCMLMLEPQQILLK